MVSAGVNGWVMGLWIAAAICFFLAAVGAQLARLSLVPAGLCLTVVGLLVEAGTTVHSINW